MHNVCVDTISKDDCPDVRILSRATHFLILVIQLLFILLV